MMKNENSKPSPNISRRNLIKALLALGITGPMLPGLLHASNQKKILKKIPSSGEQLPVIGIGTSRTFDALNDEMLLRQLKQVMQLSFSKALMRLKTPDVHMIVISTLMHFGDLLIQKQS